MDLKYPNSLCHSMLIFTHQSGEDIVLVIDGIEKTYNSVTDMEYELVKMNKYYIFWRSVDDGEVIYIIMKNPGENIDIDTTASDKFTDWRFVRFLWEEDTIADPRRVNKNNIIRLRPQDTLVRAGERYIWRIVSRGKESEVRSQSEPMVYCDNSGNEIPGLYTVSLDVQYDGVTVRHERKNIYRYDFV